MAALVPISLLTVGRQGVKILMSLMALAGSVAFLVQDLTIRAFEYL